MLILFVGVFAYNCLSRYVCSMHSAKLSLNTCLLNQTDTKSIHPVFFTWFIIKNARCIALTTFTNRCALVNRSTCILKEKVWFCQKRCREKKTKLKPTTKQSFCVLIVIVCRREKPKRRKTNSNSNLVMNFF